MKKNLKQIQKYLVFSRPIGRLVVAKMIFGLATLICLLSFSPTDPTPLNLLTATEGLGNWLGLPGALFAGMLRDLLGFSAYLVPFNILFLTRNQQSLKLGGILKDSLEIFSLSALGALLLNAPNETVIQWTGIWGILVKEAISGTSLLAIGSAVFIAYQLMFFKENRIDSSLFTIFWVLVLLSTGWLVKLYGSASIVIQKLSKYLIINGFSPLGSTISRSSETSRERFKTSYQQTKEKINSVNLQERVLGLIEKLTGRKKTISKTTAELKTKWNQSQQDRIIEASIKRYRESCYISDSKVFISLEEEI